MRTYDYRDAEEHVELLQERARSDAESDAYELPDVEGCKPKSLKEGWLRATGIQKAMSTADDLQVQNILAAMLRLMCGCKATQATQDDRRNSGGAQ